MSLGRAVVTASFAGHLYAQQEDRASGMRVNTAEAFPPGTRIWATGTAATFAGEKVLNAQMMWASETGPVPTPLTMSNRDAAAIRPGLHPAGLLIRTSGRITRVEADRFYLSDGSTGGDGLAVLLPGFPAANTGRFAAVSGALGVTTGPNGPAPALKPRSPEDVSVVD